MGRILIIEDEADIAEMYKWILELDGHEILGIFSTPMEALDATLAAPDVIVLDERLRGGISGSASLPELRRRFPVAQIIMATADPAIVAKRHHLGVQKALLKPFSLESLSINVRALVPAHTK